MARITLMVHLHPCNPCHPRLCSRSSHSYLYDFGRKDIRNLPELRDDVILNEIVDEQQSQRLAALLFPAQMHTGDIDPASAQNRSDGTDDAGLVVVRKENHVSVRHYLERIAVDIYDARQLVGEDRS